MIHYDTTAHDVSSHCRMMASGKGASSIGSLALVALLNEALPLLIA